jgi:hypothetical protein
MLLVAGTGMTLAGSFFASSGAIFGAVTMEMLGGVAIVLAVWIRSDLGSLRRPLKRETDKETGILIGGKTIGRGSPQLAASQVASEPHR